MCEWLVDFHLFAVRVLSVAEWSGGKRGRGGEEREREVQKVT